MYSCYHSHDHPSLIFSKLLKGQLFSHIVDLKNTKPLCTDMVTFVLVALTRPLGMYCCFWSFLLRFLYFRSICSFAFLAREPFLFIVHLYYIINSWHIFCPSVKQYLMLFWLWLFLFLCDLRQGLSLAQTSLSLLSAEIIDMHRLAQLFPLFADFKQS